MNPRERMLVIVIASLVGVGFAAKVVVPKWIRPMFDYDKRIDALRDDQASLKPARDQLETAFRKYQEYVARTGSNDENDVRDEFAETLNDVLLQAKLEVDSVAQREPTADKKTGVVTLSYGFQAQGTLTDAMSFMKRFYEVRHLARFKDVRLTPIKSRGGGPVEQVKLTGSIDVLVPPKPDTIVPPSPDAVAAAPRRIRNDILTSISDDDPFNPPAKPEPPPPPPPDDSDDEKFAGGPPPPPPPPPSATRDPQGAQKMIRVCIQTPAEEVLVVNSASKQKEYITKGQDIDGGKLMMVHPLGAVVRRKDAGRDHEFLYPIGESLADSVRIDQAQRHPELRAFARKFLKDEKAREREAAEESAAREAADREAAERETAEREAAARQDALSKMWRDDLIGPPVELSAMAESMLNIEAPKDDVEPTLEVMGPPDMLAGSSAEAVEPARDDDPAPEPPRPQRARRTASSRREPVGPPAELAGSSTEPKQEKAPKRTAPGKSRLRRPSGSD